MLKIKDSRKKQGSFFSNLYSNYKNFIDPAKEENLLNEISLGLGNRVVYQKFPDFVWPLWLSEAGDFYSPDYHSAPNLLLINTNFRDWQTFTNFLSNDEIYIDRSGMITGPGDSPWSVEFWYCSGSNIYRPQKYHRQIKPFRDSGTGEICVTGKLGSAQFSERIAGARSSVDEALVSYGINANSAEDKLFVVLRPYNCLSIGGVNDISFDITDCLLKVNGKNSIGFENKPDSMLTGSGADGDVDCSLEEFNGHIACSFGMASAALGFNLKKGNNVINLRIPLDKNRQLPAHKFDFIRTFKDFKSFCEMRMAEGLKIEVPDEDLAEILRQSKLTMFNNNSNDFNPGSVNGFRNLYFLSYAMNRAGLGQKSEKLVNRMIDQIDFNIKRPEFYSVINASYLIGAFYECYLHRRDMEFLQSYFPAIRRLGNYVYDFSSGIHSVAQLQGNTLNDYYIKGAVESDFIIILSAMNNVSYLSRCMGIFGDEIKYKNESERIQSIIRNVLDKRREKSLENFSAFRSLISFPDVIISGYKEHDYKDFFSCMTEEKNFPLFDNFAGIDLMGSALTLMHFITLKDQRFTLFYKKLFSYIDDFFTLPEFSDPVLKRGVRGDGNSKIIAALIFVIARNRLFLDRPDRLEIFPEPETSWFIPGKKIKVEDAITRYGKITFTADTSADEIKLTFIGLPKFIPSDIMINIPVESSIITSDDFILKRKVENSYIINGWPSVVRFSTSRKSGPAMSDADNR